MPRNADIQARRTVKGCHASGNASPRNSTAIDANLNAAILRPAIIATGPICRFGRECARCEQPDRDKETEVTAIHPSIVEIYRRKVERLAETRNQPAERDEAADVIRGRIERVTLFPAPGAGR